MSDLRSAAGRIIIRRMLVNSLEEIAKSLFELYELKNELYCN